MTKLDGKLIRDVAKASVSEGTVTVYVRDSDGKFVFNDDQTIKTKILRGTVEIGKRYR